MRALFSLLTTFIAGVAAAMTGSVISFGALAADISDPYVTRNINPFVQVYGLPATQSARLTGWENFSGGITLEAANNFTTSKKGAESIFVDGESYRATLRWRYGVSEGLELGLDVPYVSHQAGRMDNFIESWHSAFGFPNGGREKFPQDQLSYRYSDNGQQLANVSRNGDGLGDVSLSVGYQLSASEVRHWALRGGVKLPTGDADNLRGSDSTDVYAGLNVSDHSLADSGLVFHASMGGLWMDEGEVLNDIRKDWVLYGSGTVSWLLSPKVSLKAQVDAHSAFYDSELKELGSHSAQLIIGGTIRLSQQITLDLSVSEDIAVDTAPDVVFQIGLNIAEW